MIFKTELLAQGRNMNIIQKIAKNMMFLLASQIITLAINFFYTTYTARYLGAEGLGVLSFALAFAGIFGLFSDFGINSLTIREVARDKRLAGKYVGNALIIKVCLSVISFGIIAIAINLLGYPEQTIKVVYLFALYTVFSNFNGIFYSIFSSFENMEYSSIGRILNSVLMLIGTFIAIEQGVDILGFAFVYLFVNMLVLVYSSFIFIFKFKTYKLEFNCCFSRSLLLISLPFFLSAIVDTIGFKTDILMLSFMKGDVITGWYSAAFRLMEVLIFIPSIFGGAIYPVLSNFYVSSQESLRYTFQKSFEYLIIASLPIAVGTTILADRIILTIYGKDFISSIIVLQILIWTIPTIFLSYFIGTMLASVNKQYLAFKISFICAFFNIMANLLLIPKYGLIGASVATVISSLLACTLSLCFLPIPIHISSNHNFIMKPLIASLIMGIFLFNFKEMNLLALICLSIFVYSITLIIIGTFSKTDINLVKMLFNSNQ